MTHFWYAIARFLQKTFDLLLVPFGWLPVTIISIILGIGLVYWLSVQAKYSRRAKEKGEYI